MEVLSDPNLVHKILLNGASTELRLAHRLFMMELCDARLGSMARQARDELWACLRQAMRQLFGTGQHHEATEILVEHIMLVSPGANKEKMLNGRTFDERGELEDWLLSFCNISQLPESFCALVCRGDVNLGYNQLQSLSEGFGDVTVGGGLYLTSNQLRSLPEGFGGITVGGNLSLRDNQLQSLPEGFGDITVGGTLFLGDNQLTEFPSVFFVDGRGWTLPNVDGRVLR